MIRALLLAVSLLAVPTPAAASPPPLTVLSFNIHHAAGLDGVVDLDRLAAEIRDSHADVVGLQEVDRHYGERSGWADEAAELSRRLGMRVVFGANLDLAPPSPGAPRRQYGTAILSRHPVVSWRNTLLPKGDPAEEQRGLLEAVVAAPGGPVRVMSTHFQHDDAVSRLLQARAVAAHVEASRQPVVLTGDLNAPPIAPEVTTLTALLTDPGNANTHPADAPTARIDYVLTSLRPVRSEVLNTASSDHRPVRTTLTR